MTRQPTDLDARELLNSSGIRYKDRGNYYLMRCPYHNDKNPSAVLYKDKWLFKCFSCGQVCSFKKFYKDLKGTAWEERGEFSIVPVPIKDALDFDSRKHFEIEDGKITSVYDNAHALSYCRARGISDEFMKHFDFKATDICRFKAMDNGRRAVWTDRLLIPINFNDKPYSLEGRDYTRKQVPKCLYPRGAKTDICFNQDSIDISKTLIVCEGIMDIHKIWSLFTKNVTCTFGVSLSQQQRQFLCNATDLILFVDDDSAGRNSVSIFEKFMNKDFRVALVKDNDPGSASVKQIEDAISHPVLWTEFLLDDIKVFEKSSSHSFSLKTA